MIWGVEECPFYGHQCLELQTITLSLILICTTQTRKRTQEIFQREKPLQSLVVINSHLTSESNDVSLLSSMFRF